MNSKVIAIFGPTGVGKTALSLGAALNCGEIISVDSMQVYRYMDIGTAKPTIDELQSVKHHLIDILDPNEQFSAGNFVREAKSLIPQIIERGSLPFMVGGTGLYFNSLINGLSDIPPVKKEISESVAARMSAEGQERMYAVLQEVDPVYAEKIHSNDKQRTQRALEVYFSSGRAISSYHAAGRTRPDYDFIKIGLTDSRENLYDRINRRVDKMIDEGLLDEVKKLLDMGYTKDDPGLNAIGYKEFIAYLEGQISFDEAVRVIKTSSRRYAKRQFTWFNAIDDVKWFNIESRDQVIEFISQALLL